MSPHKLEERSKYRRRRSHLWNLRTVFAGILCLATVAGAQETVPLLSDDAADTEEALPRYTVEIIVFTYADSASSGSEIFVADEVDEVIQPVEPLVQTDAAAQSTFMPKEAVAEDPVAEYGDFLGYPEEEELTELIASDRIDLNVLQPDELTMTAIHEKLVLLDAYQPVMWAGWTQTTLAEEETPLIRLRRLANIPLKFDGTLKLYLSRFLHLVIDVSMDGASPKTAEPSQPSLTTGFERGYVDDFGYPIRTDTRIPTVHYRIVENRIMKNDDIRYFDHPKFGVLAKITRYEVPEDDEQIESEPNQVVPDAVPADADASAAVRRDNS